MLPWFLAAFHLLGLGIGLGSVSLRAWALRAPMQPERLPLVFIADGVWGLAAMLWISTGVWRAFGGVEKGSTYYLASNAFWIKMGLLGIIIALEILPMVTFIRWRAQRGRGDAPALQAAPVLSRISALQALLVVAMVFAATAMARGLGY